MTELRISVPETESQSPIMRRGLVLAIIALPIAFVYWPGLQGFWTRDDFMQLAFARLIGSPWALFVHDHYFPVPGSIFRPLGFASFWLWQALFGTNYFAHAFADMLLHVAVSLALYRVFRASGIELVPATLFTLVFALHPAVLGTALWWSARFDLLATLFSFVAIRAALDHVRQPRWVTLLATLLAALAALLSKETALAAVVAIGLVWAHWAWTDRVHRADAARAIGALGIVTLLFLVWRWVVIGTAASGLAGDASLSAAIGKGFLDWIANLGGYLSFWPRLDLAERVALSIAAVGSMVCAGMSWTRRKSEGTSPTHGALLLCGLCLFVLPALLQAPVVALNASPLRGDVSVVEAAMQSRLYYLSIGGGVIVLSVLVHRMLSGPRASKILLSALVVGACVFGWASRQSAIEFVHRTAAPKAMAEAAASAIDRLIPTATRCHVVLLGVEPPPEWSIYVSMDSIVKALSPDLERVERCFIHSDYVTYFYLMARDTTPDNAEPYRPHESEGRPLRWLHVGDAVVAYLDPPAAVDPATLHDMTFLRYEDGAFRDVTDDVAQGRVAVQLR